MSVSDWREAGFSDKRWLRLILISRGEKVNARDKFVLDKKIVSMVTIILMMRLTLTPTLTPEGGLTQLSLIILHTVGKNGDNLPSLDSTLHH